MTRSTLSLALVLALLPLAASAEKTTVYKTTDANGNTVYSQVDTAGATAQQVTGADPAAPAAEPAAAPKTEAEIACDRAQLNLKLIESGNRLQRDKDGDGKPEDLTAEELASEKDLAQRQTAAYCTAPPKA
jgi:hypothetical protein